MDEIRSLKHFFEMGIPRIDRMTYCKLLLIFSAEHNEFAFTPRIRG